MQSDLSSGGNDRLDGLESQEVDTSSEVSGFYIALWKADMKIKKQGL